METDTLKVEMEKVQSALDEYEKSASLPILGSPPCPSEEIGLYFNMDREHLDKISGHEASNVAARLVQQAIYIRRLSNKEHSRIKWASKLLDKAISVELASFSTYMKHENKVAAIVKNNAYAAQLYNIIGYAEQRVERLRDLSEDIKFLANILKGKSYVGRTEESN